MKQLVLYALVLILPITSHAGVWCIGKSSTGEPFQVRLEHSSRKKARVDIAFLNGNTKSFGVRLTGESGDTGFYKSEDGTISMDIEIQAASYISGVDPQGKTLAPLCYWSSNEGQFPVQHKWNEALRL